MIEENRKEVTAVNQVVTMEEGRGKERLKDDG